MSPHTVAIRSNENKVQVSKVFAELYFVLYGSSVGIKVARNSSLMNLLSEAARIFDLFLQQNLRFLLRCNRHCILKSPCQRKKSKINSNIFQVSYTQPRVLNIVTGWFIFLFQLYYICVEMQLWKYADLRAGTSPARVHFYLLREFVLHIWQ